MVWNVDQQASPDSRRRALLRALAALPLTSCAAVDPICPTDPSVSLPTGPLTIDAHCHVFNGTDLQVEKFLTLVAFRQQGALGEGARVMGSILQGLGWTFAPDRKRELAALQDVAAAVARCDTARHATAVAALRQSAYATGRAQLQAAAARSRGLEATLADPRKLGAVREIESLPASVEDYHAMRRARETAAASIAERSVSGMIAFVLQNFQYRYVSTYDYLRTYDEPGRRVVDLMAAMLVDYDWWLAKGDRTPTTIREQVEVMAQVSILTRGRVHAFVPFCPLRQVAFALRFGKDDALQIAKDAVAANGCIGVKLYPPMGFAPLGNAAHDGKRFWAREWLPAWTARDDLGQRLDDAMRALFAWCESEQVPVMAHTALSNGPSADFEALAGVDGWRRALEAYPKLRVSFGHFGDTAPVADGLARAKAFQGLMHDRANEPGSAAYADAGYFVEVLDREPALRDEIRQLYEDTARKGSASLAHRFLYGTDWEMTLTEGAIGGYLSEFVKLMDEIEQRPAIRAAGLANLSGRFFGANAVDWLGLRKGEPSRERLDAFYAKAGVPKPDWMVKVDA